MSGGIDIRRYRHGTPTPHIHDRQRSDRKRRRYGIPVKAHPVSQSIYLPPPGFLAWSLLARVVAPK